MKKQKDLLWLLAALLVFSLCACGAPTTETASPAVDDTPTASSEITEPVQLPTPSPAPEDGSEEADAKQAGDLQLKVNGHTLTAAWAENSSADALRELLADGPLTIQMSDYASMEKVGSIGQSLPTNNEQITTEAGDLILYQGNAFVIYYAPNSWNFTRLGKINNITADELKEILGSGDVSVTLSIVSED